MDSVLDMLQRSLHGHGAVAWTDYLQQQRWFGGKARPITELTWQDWACIVEGPEVAGLAWLQVHYDRAAESYLLVLAIGRTSDLDAAPAIASVSGAAIRDATATVEVALALLDGIRSETAWPTAHGRAVCLRTPALETAVPADRLDVGLLSGEHSNTSLRYGRAAVLKLIRKAVPGVHLDAEVLGFLNARRFPHVPLLLGEIRHETDGTVEDATLGLLVSLVPNEGNGWTYLLRQLDDMAGRLADSGGLRLGDLDREAAPVLAEIGRLGGITADLHLALSADDAGPDFRPEPITPSDIAVWRTAMRAQVEDALTAIARLPPRDLPPTGQSPYLVSHGLTALEALDRLVEDRVRKIRVHGDYHLGQVLKTSAGFTILDFEGEPARSLAVRRAKACALKDVAGMLRSFSYAGSAALRGRGLSDESWTDARLAWERLAGDRFLSGYLDRARPEEAIFLPRTPHAVADCLRAFLIDKAAYEVAYEANNRPDWLAIPVEGLTRLVA